MCYEDEGVYVNTYGRITKDVVLQWGEMPTSVGNDASWRGICERSPLRAHLFIVLTCMLLIPSGWLVVISRWEKVK